MSKQYKNDITVWSPEGRLHQVDYAMKSVQQGSATVGLKNRTLSVLIAFRPAAIELSLSPNKIVKLNDEMGLTYAGLIGHVNQVIDYLKNECLDRDFTHHDQLPVARLVNKLCLNMQATTQTTSKKPQGVGLIIAAYDKNEPYIYQIMPAGQCFNCKAIAIGSNSKHAYAYLKRNVHTFKTSTRDQLIFHGIRALMRTLPTEDIIKLNKSNITNMTIAEVGKDQPFELLDDRTTLEFLKKVRSERQQVDEVYELSDDDEEADENYDEDEEAEEEQE